MDHLHRFVEIFEMERGAQDRVSLNHPLPGAFECAYINFTAQRAARLLDVSARAGIETVEVHALLHGRECVDVVDLVHASRQSRELISVESRERKVRRRVEYALHCAALADKRTQSGDERIGESFNRFAVVNVRAVCPPDAQPPARNTRVDLEQMFALLSRALCRAAALTRRSE